MSFNAAKMPAISFLAILSVQSLVRWGHRTGKCVDQYCTALYSAGSKFRFSAREANLSCLGSTMNHEPWLIQTADVPISTDRGVQRAQADQHLLPPGSPVIGSLPWKLYSVRNWQFSPHKINFISRRGGKLSRESEDVTLILTTRKICYRVYIV